VVKVSCQTYNTLKIFFLASVYYDKKTRKEHLLIADELRELFVSHLDFVLKKSWKEERDLTVIGYVGRSTLKNRWR